MELRIVKMIALVALWMGMTVGLHAQTVVEYIHTDALGTPVAVTNAAGTVIERSVYEPYGQLINRPLTDGPGFTGHVQDAATGLTYMQQRYYDPGIGRFLSIDPVSADANTGSMFNRYNYAYNNPYKFTDPDGRCPVCAGVLRQAAVGAGVGALVEIAAQKITKPGESINWKSVGVSAGVGTVTGGTGSVIRAVAVRGGLSVAKSVVVTAGANAATSAAGSAADSLANGEIPNPVKMVTAAVIGGTLSYGAGRVANADAIALQKMASAPVTSPQAIGAHIAATTQSAGSTAATQSAVSVVAENGSNVAGAAVQKRIEQRIDKNK